MASFKNQVVLITGAGSGIGRQFARVLASEGAAIAALDRDATALQALAEELRERRVATAVADVTDAPALQVAVRQLETALGPTDLLIASAGVGYETSALGWNLDDVTRLLAVNLLGVVNSIDAVLPGMRERRRGHLAALSSLASYRGLPGMAAYCASKAGVNAFLEALRVELKPLGIAVTTICPGWIQTPLTDKLELSRIRKMPVEAAVNRMVASLRARRPFVAFPRSGAWLLRLMSLLPCGLGDRMVRSYVARQIRKG
jgi:NADP-dependent 3-hydroxy acid dehydrogenase YdfG